MLQFNKSIYFAGIIISIILLVCINYIFVSLPPHERVFNTMFIIANSAFVVFIWVIIAINTKIETSAEEAKRIDNETYKPLEGKYYDDDSKVIVQ